MSYTAEELKKWWPARCPECGWRGLSRDASGGEAIGATGDYGEVICPRCEENVFAFEIFTWGGSESIVEDDHEPETVAACSHLPIQARLLGDGRQWWNGRSEQRSASATIERLTAISIEVLYGKSSDIEAPENQNEHFRSGYAAGLAATEESRSRDWFEGWRDYGEPEAAHPRWCDWKRGFASGRLAALREALTRGE